MAINKSVKTSYIYHAVKLPLPVDPFVSVSLSGHQLQAPSRLLTSLTLAALALLSSHNTANCLALYSILQCLKQVASAVLVLPRLDGIQYTCLRSFILWIASFHMEKLLQKVMMVTVTYHCTRHKILHDHKEVHSTTV